MVKKILGSEAVPKVFQTFNSLLGGIVRKRNATIVGPSKQLVGEFPEVDFERLYQYYHHWDQVKTAVDVMHQKFRGSGIKIKSNNEYFNVFIEKWWDVTNSEKKWSQFIFSLLITGSAIMELQYTPDQRLGNTEQIPMQTIYRVFRDQFGNELKLVQIVDGVFKELDPQFFIHSTINNPDRQAFGKSMFHTLASPRPVAGTVDPFTGEAINPTRNSIPLLDAQAKIQNNQIEISDKMAKPRLIVSAVGMPKEQMERLQSEMADPNTDQYIWIFDKPIESAELQVQAQGKFEDYTNGIDAHIDIGTIFASNVIKNPQGFSYSGAQSGLDVLDQRMSDLQSELTETIHDRLLKPLAESWGFMDFNAMEVEVSFTPTMKRLTMDDIGALDPEAVSKKEKREMYKALNIPLDDTLWEEEQQELKHDKSDQKAIQMQGAVTGVIDPSTGEPTGGDQAVDKPFQPPADKAQSKTGMTKAPTTSPPKSDMEGSRPEPTPTTTPQPTKKPKGESLHDVLIRAIANEGLGAKATIEAIKAIERIPLPPKAGGSGNDSSDLYVSQGIDDMEDKPEITDPNIRLEYGLDKDESETPPTDPSKMARGGDKPQLSPSDNAGGRFTNAGDQGIPQVPTVSEDEYNAHLQASNNGDEIQGGTGNDGITPDSDGSFKDPIDANNDMERTPETGNTDNPMPHASPNQAPLVDSKPLQMSGGSDALPDNTNDQILGGNTNDENPIVPAEGFPPDNDKKKNKKLEDSHNLGEAVKPTITEKPLFRSQPNPVQDNRDIIEGEDPFTSGTGEEPSPELNNQPQKGQARLDDAPLQDPSANKGNLGGINPSRDAEVTNQETPSAMANNDSLQQDPTDPTGANNLGDSGQVRLQNEEQSGLPQDPMQQNNSNDVMDNTNLNMKPELGYPSVKQDDYMKKVQDGSNPLEQRGEPLEDGMIIKPEDTQQHGGIGDTPITPQGMTAFDQDPNTMNDPSDSGIDEEEVDPNILHIDPETGLNYTDLTDEQGNEVPDLRFDQTPTSDEEQPEVELEYEIVTKEEYDQHLDSSKNTPMESQGAFDAELESQSMDEEAPNPFGLDQSEDPLDPVETDMAGNPVTLPTQDNNINDGIPEDKSEPSNNPSEGGGEEVPLGDSGSTSKPEKSTTSGQKKPTSSAKPDQSKEEPTKEKSDKKSKGTGKDVPTGKSEKSDKKEKDGGEDDGETDTPQRKGSVKDIIKREHELIDSGVDEEEVHGILEDEFGEDKMDKAVETKTWKNRR